MIEIIHFSYFFVFFLGAIFGSFLNVIQAELEPNVLEIKKKKSFWQRINRRSHCPKCKQKLLWWQLVPILSYIFLKGKCSFCGEKISIKYFLVEFFSGVLFLLLWYFLLHKYLFFLSSYFLVEFVFWISVSSLLILIFLFDLKEKIIPDILLILIIPFALFYSVFDFSDWTFHFLNIFNSLKYGILFSFPFYAIWYLSKGRAIGYADWKLVFVLSLFIETFFQNLIFVFGSFWIGALVTVPLLFLGKKYKLKSEVPFGPFIIMSFLVIIFNSFSYNFLPFFS